MAESLAEASATRTSTDRGAPERAQRGSMEWIFCRREGTSGNLGEDEVVGDEARRDSVERRRM